MASGWNFLAGFANSLGNSLESRRQEQLQKEKEERAYKLAQMQKDAQEKREQFLIDYRINAEQAAKDKDHERTKDDVAGTVVDKETGDVYGRTKSGELKLLHGTSDDYKGDLNAKRDVDVAKKESGIGVDTARVSRMGAEVKNINSQIANRDKPKDNSQKIREDYEKLFRQAQTDDAAAAKAAEKAGRPYAPIDPAHMEQSALARLYSVYGGDTVRKAMGAQPEPTQPAPQQPAPTAPPTPQAPPPQQKPGQPTPEQILAEANKAIQSGAPQDKVEARIKLLFQQYGYTQ